MQTVKNRVNHNQMMQRENFLIYILINEVFHSLFTSHPLKPTKVPHASMRMCAHTQIALLHGSHSPIPGAIPLPSGTKPNTIQTLTYPKFVHFNHKNISKVYFPFCIVHVQYIFT
jgi:hypothetical protein